MDEIPRGTGAIRDAVDERDHDFAEIAAALPEFDWDKGYDVESDLAAILGLPGFALDVDDQNGSFSCGGQAWAKYGGVKEALATKSYEKRSSKFIYSQTAVPQGGSAGRDNCKLVIDQGWATEALCPSYEDGRPPTEAFMRRKEDIGPDAFLSARGSAALSYANTPASINLVAQAVANFGGLVLGIEGSNNGTWTGAAPIPPSKSEWAHWIYAGKAAYYQGKRAIKILNSWGRGIGEAGWQWITEDYFDSGFVWPSWTLVFRGEQPDVNYKHRFEKDLVFGQINNPEVVALQKCLKARGFFPATMPETGNYYENTRKAVAAFQRYYKVAPPAELDAVNGRRVGQKTRAQLNALFV